MKFTTSFSSSQRPRETEKRGPADEVESTPGVSKALGRSGEGVNEKGEGVRRKEIACSQSQTLY